MIRQECEFTDIPMMINDNDTGVIYVYTGNGYQSEMRHSTISLLRCQINFSFTLPKCYHRKKSV